MRRLLPLPRMRVLDSICMIELRFGSEPRHIHISGKSTPSKKENTDADWGVLQSRAVGKAREMRIVQVAIQVAKCQSESLAGREEIAICLLASYK